MEKICAAYKRKLRSEGRRVDGKSIKQLTTDFRIRFRTEIQIIAARRVANLALQGGMTWKDGAISLH